jgi:hypothetical protein
MVAARYSSTSVSMDPDVFLPNDMGAPSSSVSVAAATSPSAQIAPTIAIAMVALIAHDSACNGMSFPPPCMRFHATIAARSRRALANKE